LALLRNQNRPISWVTAPAGSGKSHLLQQIADEHRGPVVALRIEAGDADPGRFFQRLAGTVRKAHRRFTPPTFGPDDLNYLRDFACRLFEHVAERAGSRVLFAFDDMHHLNPAPEISEALALAVDKVSDRLSLVAASRESPPSSWARFLADGRMARVGPEMLLMDADEIRSLLLSHPDWRHGADDGIVSDLLAATEGWASGVGVVIEFTKTRPEGIGALCRDEARDVVFGSFSDQIFASFSMAERHQLMLVAPCPVLYPDVLREVLGDAVCALLERLFRNNTLVSKDYSEHAHGQPGYRLHSLLRDFLRHKASTDLRSEEVREVCARMAGKLLAHGDDDAARELLLEAQDWTRLADHLGDIAETLFATGRIRSLTRYLNALPPAVRRESVVLTYWHGICLLHLDPSASRRELADAYGRLKACGDHANAIRAWGALVDAIWFEWEDCARLDPCIDELPYLSAAADALSDPALTAVLTKGAFAALSIRRPDHPDFGAWEMRNLALFQRRLPKSETIRRGLQLMIHYVYGAGDRRKAEVVRARLQQIYESDTESVADHCVYYVVNAAHQFWFSSDGTRAPGTVMTGLAVTERLKLPFWDVPMLNAAMFRLAADENVEGLRNMLTMLDERLSADSREHDIAISHHFSAYLAWLAGDHEKALIAIDAACRIAADSGFCISPVYYGVGRTAVLASLGRRREAWGQLSLTRRGAVKQNSRVMQFMAHLVGAAMALHAGRRAFALKYLRRAFELGDHERFCAIPWLRLDDRSRLCALALECGVAPGYARFLGDLTRTVAVGPGRPLICTLGRADILRNGRSELTSRKPQAMPLLLMLHLTAAGQPGRSSDQIIDAIWPEADAETGRDRLKTTLYRLRSLLGDRKAISSTGGRIRIDGTHVDVDAWKIEQLIAAQGDSIDIAERVLDIYHGGFVDLYSGHMDLLLYREHLAQQVETLVLRTGKRLMASEEWERAAALFEKSLERFGVHEEFLSHLKECFGRAGRKEVLKRLDECWQAELSEYI
jgi:hypothetical protein